MDAVQASMTHTLLSGLSVLKPYNEKNLFAAKGLQGGDLFLMIKSLGNNWSKEVDQETYNHWEEDYIINNFQSLGAVTGQGAGDAVLITLHTNSVDASNRFYPVAGDEILFGTPAARVPGTIRSINITTPTAPVLTVYPKDITATIPDIDAGDTLFIYSNSFGEGTDQPSGRVSGVDQYTNHLKELKHSIDVTGHAITDGLWFDIPWTTSVKGAPAGSYFRKANVDLDYKMAQSIGGALQFDVITTNTALTDPTEGTLLDGTLGFFPAIDLYGYASPYTPGNMTIGDFDTFGKAFVRENVTNKDILAWMGYDLYVELENLLPDFLDNTNVDYTKKQLGQNLWGANMEMAVAIGFSHFQKSGKNYMFKINYDFSNQKTYGSTGYDYSNMGALIPMGTSKDARTGDMVGSIGYRYKKKGDYSREFEMWDTGSVYMNTPTNSVDKKFTHIRAHIGAQQIGVNRFISLLPQ